MARRRVHGPYKHGNKYRIVIVAEDGTQVVESFGSEAEAEEEKQRNLEQLESYQGITVRRALDDYEVYLRTRRKPRSVDTSRQRIEKLLTARLDAPLSSVTEYSAQRAYSDLIPLVSVDYHHNALNETKSFMRWCMERPRKWIKKSPFAVVKVVGKKKKHAKPQLRIDETRKFVESTKRVADSGDIAGVVGLASLYFGTRITELVSRPVRDLDDDGWVLWIPDAKTENGRRTLDVPEDLRPYLLTLAKDKKPEEPLFKGPRRGKTITRYTAYDMVKRMCRVAGVPEVPPHGLRGTHTSIARERGATPNVIAHAVGHGSYEGVTAQHYVAPGVEERAKQKAMLAVVQGGKW